VLEQGWLSLASKTPNIANLLHLQLHEVDRSLPSKRTAHQTPTDEDSNNAGDLDESRQFCWKLEVVQLPSTAPYERLKQVLKYISVTTYTVEYVSSHMVLIIQIST
jgi:hypothetical protein